MLSLHRLEVPAIVTCTATLVLYHILPPPPQELKASSVNILGYRQTKLLIALRYSLF